jgi:hypothetical protein
MIRKLLFWIAGYLPTKLISEAATETTPERPYLERYFLMETEKHVAYLHRFVDSDPDRAKHSHPWRWALSLLLIGDYIEANSYGQRLVRWFNLITGETFHRVILKQNPDGSKRDVWTLFIHPKQKSKSWGFADRFPWMDVQGAPAESYIYIPHKSSPEEDWWKTAPKGRYSRRLNEKLQAVKT